MLKPLPKLCGNCNHVEQKSRTRKRKGDSTDKKVPVYYCKLSGAEVLTVLKACPFYNKPFRVEGK